VHSDAALTFPWLRVWLAIYQPCFSPHTNPVKDYRFPVQTDQQRRWRHARIREALRFVRFAPHSHPTGGSTRGAFQRGHLQNCAEDVYLYGLAAAFRAFRSTKNAQRMNPQLTDKPEWTRGTFQI